MKISIRSTDVLSILGVISIALMLWVETTKKEAKQPHFDEKIAASKRMAECINYLKEVRFKNEISVDNINDPNETKIIGTKFSEITSGEGSLPIKLSTVNPNIAALIVELFKEAGIQRNDHVAICATGSFPALNIALCAVADVLGLRISFIGSVTSSSWGATDPDYTYLDMHTILVEGGLLKQKIIASSIGGNEDLGKTLSTEGRELALQAIRRNNMAVINGISLMDNIAERIVLFKDQEKLMNKPISIFVNIGGGTASLGSSANSDALPTGYLKGIKLRDFPDKQGVCFKMAVNKTKIINLLNLDGLLKGHHIPIDPVPLPEVGDGELFYKLKYDYRNVCVSLFVLITMLVGVIIYDKRRNALGKNVIYEKNETSNYLSDSI